MVTLVLVFLTWALLVPAAHLAVFVAPLVLVLSLIKNGGVRRRDLLRTAAIIAVALVVLVFYYDLPVRQRMTQARYERSCRRDSGFAVPASPVEAYGLELAHNHPTHWTLAPDWLGNLVKDPTQHLSSGSYQGFAFVERGAMRYAGRRDDYTEVEVDVAKSEIALAILAPEGKGLQKYEILVIDRRSNQRVARLHGYTFDGESCPSKHEAKHFLASSVVPIKPPGAPIIPVQRELRAIKVHPDDVPPPMESAQLSISGPIESCPTLRRTLKKLHGRIEFSHGNGIRKIALHDDEGRRQVVSDAACWAGLVYVLLRDSHDSRSPTMHLHTYDSQGNLIERSTVSFDGFPPRDVDELLGDTVFAFYTNADRGRVRFSLYKRVNIYETPRKVQFERMARLAIVPHAGSSD